MARDSWESPIAICKEAAVRIPKTGNSDDGAADNHPGHSMAWKFFTDDKAWPNGYCLMTFPEALPMTSALRFSPLGPLGIPLPDVIKHHEQIANEDHSHTGYEDPVLCAGTDLGK
jgi:hypothetical protein